MLFVQLLLKFILVVPDDTYMPCACAMLCYLLHVCVLFVAARGDSHDAAGRHGDCSRDSAAVPAGALRGQNIYQRQHAL